jgi:hypothetical protein
MVASLIQGFSSTHILHAKPIPVERGSNQICPQFSTGLSIFHVMWKLLPHKEQWETFSLSKGSPQMMHVSLILQSPLFYYLNIW